MRAEHFHVTSTGFAGPYAVLDAVAVAYANRSHRQLPPCLPAFPAASGRHFLKETGGAVLRWSLTTAVAERLGLDAGRPRGTGGGAGAASLQVSGQKVRRPPP